MILFLDMNINILKIQMFLKIIHVQLIFQQIMFNVIDSSYGHHMMMKDLVYHDKIQCLNYTIINRMHQ